MTTNRNGESLGIVSKVIFVRNKIKTPHWQEWGNLEWNTLKYIEKAYASFIDELKYFSSISSGISWTNADE